MAKITKTEQSRRFKEAAREAETDDSPEEFERVFAKVVPPKVGKPKAATPHRPRRVPR